MLGVGQAERRTPLSDGDADPAAAALPVTLLTPSISRATDRQTRRRVAILVLAAALLLSMLLAAARGAVSMPVSRIAGVVGFTVGLPLDVTWTAAEQTIVWQLRLPRVVAAALVGAALATSGVLLQGLFRNPLADPFVLGMSAGAGLAATVGVAFFTGALAPQWIRWAGFGPVPIAASLGGLVAVVFVYSLARRGGRVPVTRMLLAGFALSSMLGALSTLLVLLSDRLLLQWRALLGYLVGGISVSGWAQIRVSAPLVLGGVVVAWALARWLDALLLGEEGASQVGVPVEAAKVLLVLTATALTGAAVALAGLVGFVGLIVPHAVRLTLGPGHRTLVPAAALAGATVLVLTDLLARTLIPPTELPVGAITALAGGPAFLWLLRREGSGALRHAQ